MIEYSTRCTDRYRISANRGSASGGNGHSGGARAGDGRRIKCGRGSAGQPRNVEGHGAGETVRRSNSSRVGGAAPLTYRVGCRRNRKRKVRTRSSSRGSVGPIEKFLNRCLASGRAGETHKSCGRADGTWYVDGPGHCERRIWLDHVGSGHGQSGAVIGHLYVDGIAVQNIYAT